MKKSTSVMREAILSHLLERLRITYDVDWPIESSAASQISDREIDAALAFKSDPELDELRSALARLENGTYGYCLSCKQQMSQSVLNSDPARRICPGCEREFSTHHWANLVEVPALQVPPSTLRMPPINPAEIF